MARTCADDGGFSSRALFPANVPRSSELYEVRLIVDVTFDKAVYAPIPARFEAGTGNIADAEVGGTLSKEGIAVRAGHLCAQPALRRFGLETTARPSLALYNAREDVDKLVTTLFQLQSAWPS